MSDFLGWLLSPVMYVLVIIFVFIEIVLGIIDDWGINGKRAESNREELFRLLANDWTSGNLQLREYCRLHSLLMHSWYKYNLFDSFPNSECVRTESERRDAVKEFFKIHNLKKDYTESSEYVCELFKKHFLQEKFNHLFGPIICKESDND